MLLRLQEFRAKSVKYDHCARRASDALTRASYAGLAQACREVSKMIVQLEELRALARSNSPSCYYN
jgi:hypothetical protein